MNPTVLVAIGIAWGAILTFALSLAKAASKPAPPRVIPGWDQRVTHVWECPECGLRVGFGGCTSAPPRCSGGLHAREVEMEQVLGS